MSSSQGTIRWSKLSNITDAVTQPFINKHNRVIFPIADISSTEGKRLSAFTRYDCNKDKCIELWKLETPSDCWPACTYAVDIENEIMYIPETQCIFTLHFKTNMINARKIQNCTLQIYSDSKSIFIAGKLHIFEFAACDSLIHAIYDPETHEYEESMIENPNEYDFDDNSKVHLPFTE